VEATGAGDVLVDIEAGKKKKDFGKNVGREGGCDMSYVRYRNTSQRS